MSIDNFHLGVKALIRNSAGDVLIMLVNPEHLRGGATAHYDLPGGRIERGESVEQALSREIIEETGLKSFEIGKSIGMGLSNMRIPHKSGDDIGLILAIFEVTVPVVANIEISDEHTFFKWVSPTVAAQLLSIKFPPDLCTLISNI
jgi:8-oxo-dGTP diphosphatase